MGPGGKVCTAMVLDDASMDEVIEPMSEGLVYTAS
jgi:hypothetical protein